jgi:hypothetical protein
MISHRAGHGLDAGDLPRMTHEEDWAEHKRTYRWFVKGMLIFAAHVLAVLLILAWVFADNLSTPPIVG